MSGGVTQQSAERGARDAGQASAEPPAAVERPVSSCDRSGTRSGFGGDGDVMTLGVDSDEVHARRKRNGQVAQIYEVEKKNGNGRSARLLPDGLDQKTVADRSVCGDERCSVRPRSGRDEPIGGVSGEFIMTIKNSADERPPRASCRRATVSGIPRARGWPGGRIRGRSRAAWAE
jgi:hypothetical protein